MLTDLGMDNVLVAGPGPIPGPAAPVLAAPAMLGQARALVDPFGLPRAMHGQALAGSIPFGPPAPTTISSPRAKCKRLNTVGGSLFSF